MLKRIVAVVVGGLVALVLFGLLEATHPLDDFCSEWQGVSA